MLIADACALAGQVCNAQSLPNAWTMRLIEKLQTLPLTFTSNWNNLTCCTILNPVMYAKPYKQAPPNRVTPRGNAGDPRRWAVDADLKPPFHLTQGEDQQITT